MEAHLATMLAVQQLFTDAARQQQAHQAQALEHLRAVEAQAAAAEEDAISGPMFSKFDSDRDGKITAEECVLRQPALWPSPFPAAALLTPSLSMAPPRASPGSVPPLTRPFTAPLRTTSLRWRTRA